MGPDLLSENLTFVLDVTSDGIVPIVIKSASAPVACSCLCPLFCSPSLPLAYVLFSSLLGISIIGISVSMFSFQAAARSDFHIQHFHQEAHLSKTFKVPFSLERLNTSTFVVLLLFCQLR